MSFCMFHLFYNYQPYQNIYSHRKLHNREKLSCLSFVTLFWAKFFFISSCVYDFTDRMISKECELAHSKYGSQGWLVCFQINRHVSCYQGKETEMKRVGLAALGAPGSSAAWLSVFHCKLKLLAWTKHCEAAHCLPLTPTQEYFTYE